MKTVVFITAAIFFTSVSVLTDAQVVRDRVEKSTDRKEIRVTKEQLERDVKEKEAFSAKLEKFRLAYLDRDPARIKRLQAQLLNDMNREIEQSERKTFADAGEVRRSNREVASSSRDVRQSRRDRRTKYDSRRDDARDLRDDRRDRRDDVRDRNDDHRDLNTTAMRLEKQREVKNRFAAWSFGTGAPTDIEGLAEYRLLKEFEQTLVSDINASKAELGEDTRELREDRRELREDKRERREVR